MPDASPISTCIWLALEQRIHSSISSIHSQELDYGPEGCQKNAAVHNTRFQLLLLLLLFSDFSFDLLSPCSKPSGSPFHLLDQSQQLLQMALGYWILVWKKRNPITRHLRDNCGRETMN